MKKSILYLTTFSLLLYLSISCRDDGPIKVQETLSTASFDPIDKVFIVTYTSGETETLEAVLDASTSPTTASATLKNGEQLTVNDASEAGEILFSNRGNYKSSEYDDVSNTFVITYDKGFNQKLKTTKIIIDLNETIAILDLDDGDALLYNISNPSKGVEYITKKGSLISASYNNLDSRYFILRFSSDYRISVDAYIDESTNPASANITLTNGTFIYKEDASKSGEAIIKSSQPASSNKYVNDWIYDNMNVYYLWNYKIPEIPNFSLYPEDFFNSILNKYGPSNIEGDRYSWIDDNYLELLDNLSGIVSHEIGFEYILVGTDNTRTQFYALVLYPKYGSDAEAKGIDRGRFVTQIDGQNITEGNYINLFGGTGTKRLSMADWVYSPTEEEYQLQNSGDVTINMHSSFAENPVYMDSIYSNGGKKTGYLVYNFFAVDKGDKSYDYDKDLMNRLSELKSQGVNEMVLDLRYNSGGAVSSAIALASALVKNRSTKSILTTSQYNSIIHKLLVKEYGSDYNKDFFIDKIDTARYDNKGKLIEKIKITDVPSLNLSRLYVLTSEWTASASEFVINGLKPYMDVILIGETTYGKNVGSLTLYEENDPNNKWGMQPIIVKFANSLGFSDFTAGFTPDYKVDEFENLFLYDFGDTNDPLLSTALSHITGQTKYTRSASEISTPFRSSQVNEKMYIDKREKSRSFEMYDDIRDEDIRKIMSK